MTFGNAANAVAEAFVTLRADTKQFEADSKAAINNVFKNVDAETQRALNQTFFPDAAKAQEKAAQQAQAAADKQFKAIAKGAVATGAALTATGLLALKFSNDFDAAFDRIAAGTGATGQRLDALNQSFENVFRDVPADMGAVAEAVTLLNSRLSLTGKPLEALAAQLVNLSRITGTDVTANTEVITRVFGAWNITTENQTAALDKLFRASQLTGTGVAEIGRLVTQYGPSLRQFGFSFDEAAALLGKFEQEGVNTEIVLSSLKIALTRFAAEGKAPREALQETINRIRDLGESAESTRLAVETFGSRAGPEIAAAIREGRFEIELLFQAIQSGEGSIAKTAAETDDWREKLALLKNNVLATSQPVLDMTALFGTLGGAALTTAGSLATIAGNMKELKAGAQSAIAGIAGLSSAALAAGPALLALSVALGAIYLRGRLLADDVPSWKKELEALGSVDVKLAEAKSKLVAAIANEQAVRQKAGSFVTSEVLRAEEQRKGIEKIIAALELEKNGLDLAAVTIAKYDKAALDAAYSTGTFEERIGALNQELDDLFGAATEALGVLDKFKAPPTQEMLDLEAAISQNNANLAVLQQSLLPVTQAYEDQKRALEGNVEAVRASISAGELQGRDTSALKVQLFNLEQALSAVNDAYDTSPIQQMIEAHEREKAVLSGQMSILTTNRDAKIDLGQAALGATGNIRGLFATEAEYTAFMDTTIGKYLAHAGVIGVDIPKATELATQGFSNLTAGVVNNTRVMQTHIADLKGEFLGLSNISVPDISERLGVEGPLNWVKSAGEAAADKFKAELDAAMANLKSGSTELKAGLGAAGKSIGDMLSELRSQLFSGGTREELQNQLRQAQLGKTLAGLPEGSGQVETLRKHIEAQLEAARKSGESMQANNRIQDLRLQLANKAIPTEKEQNLAFEKLLVSTEKLTTGMPSVLAANADLAGLIRMDVIPAKQAEIDAAYKLRDGVDSFWEKVNGLIAIAPAGAAPAPAAPVAPTATTAAAPEIVIKLNLNLDGDEIYQAVLRRMPGTVDSFGSVT